MHLPKRNREVEVLFPKCLFTQKEEKIFDPLKRGNFYISWNFLTSLSLVKFVLQSGISFSRLILTHLEGFFR